MIGPVRFLDIETEHRRDVDVHEVARNRREFGGDVAPGEAVDGLERLLGGQLDAGLAAGQGEEHRHLAVLEVHGQARTVRVGQQDGRFVGGEAGGEDLRRTTHRRGHGSVVRVLDDGFLDVEGVIL